MKKQAVEIMFFGKLDKILLMLWSLIIQDGNHVTVLRFDRNHIVLFLGTT